MAFKLSARGLTRGHPTLRLDAIHTLLADVEEQQDEQIALKVAIALGICSSCLVCMPPDKAFAGLQI